MATSTRRRPAPVTTAPAPLTGTENSVNIPGVFYERMRPDWEVIRDLLGGTKAMRAARERHLPQEPAESADAYNSRLARSVLFNGFKRTVKQLTGKPFSNELQLGDDVPAEIVEWGEDIDRQGQHIHLFCREWFMDSLAMGHSHVLVDFPRTTGPMTLADQRARNIRPYWVHVKAENLIGWRSVRINGVDVLTQVRIRETVVEEVGMFAEREIVQVRVIYPTFWQIWRDAGNGDWIVADSGPNTLGVIPLVTMYAGRCGFMASTPPLLDLAHLNLQHWRSSSDQEHILHVARVPVLFGKNLADRQQDGNTQPLPKFTIGPNQIIFGPENSDLKYVEHAGQAIGAGRQAILDTEDRMVVMGLEMEVRRPNVTATEKVINTEESDSELHAIVGSAEDAIEWALGFTAQWASIRTGGGSATLTKDFGISMREAAEIGDLLKMRIAREITRERFYTELQRRGFFSDDLDIEAEVEEIEATVEEEDAQALADQTSLLEARQPPPGGGAAEE
jgi:hypothetical protein